MYVYHVSYYTTHLYIASAKLDSSLKRHTAFLKRIKLGLGAENAAANIKDIQQLSLSKHVEEIVANIPEGVLKCKSEKDIWAAVEVCLVYLIYSL